MKHCPHSHLPIREEPEWIASHSENGYMTVFSLIGNDIIHFIHHSPHDDIYLSGIDSRKFLDILRYLDLTNAPVYLLVDFEKVRYIGYHYSINFVNFAFNWGRNIKMVLLYNIDENVRISIERFCLIAPENIYMRIVENYHDAMALIMAAKRSKKLPDKTDIFPDGTDSLRNELLSCMTRISLLQLFNQQLHPPAPDHELYPYFLALEAFRKDMAAKNTLFALKKKAVENDYQCKRTELSIRLKEETEKHSKQAHSHENHRLKLETEIRLRKEELREKKHLEQKMQDTAHQISSELKLPETRDNPTEKPFSTRIGTIDAAKSGAHHPDRSAANTLFIETLKARHPELGNDELEVCRLIRNNHSTKSIAAMLATSTKSMETFRYRLHKHLGLKKHQSVKNYLGSM